MFKSFTDEAGPYDHLSGRKKEDVLEEVKVDGYTEEAGNLRLWFEFVEDDSPYNPDRLNLKFNEREQLINYFFG